MRLSETIYSTLKRGTIPARNQHAPTILAALLLHLPAAAVTPTSGPETAQKYIPWTEVGTLLHGEHLGSRESEQERRAGVFRRSS
jgi:hypothetical protein